MLKVKANPLFVAIVALTVAGQAVAEPVSFTFKHKGKEALDDWIARTAKSASKADDVALLDEVIESWSGVEVPYSKDVLAGILDEYPPAAAEIVRGYIRELMEGRAKN